MEWSCQTFCGSEEHKVLRVEQNDVPLGADTRVHDVFIVYLLYSIM